MRWPWQKKSMNQEFMESMIQAWKRKLEKDDPESEQYSIDAEELANLIDRYERLYPKPNWLGWAEVGVGLLFGATNIYGIHSYNRQSDLSWRHDENLDMQDSKVARNAEKVMPRFGSWNGVKHNK